MKYEPRVYQTFAEEHLMKYPYAALFMEMGLGKTVVTLNAIRRLMYEELEADTALIIAPKKVIDNVWTGEIARWDHLNFLKVSKVVGNATQRVNALRKKADIYMISCDNIDWLITHYMTAFPFDICVIDESSKFKNEKSKRFKALKQARPLMKRVIELTGTPASNGLVNIWSQIYLLDRGERLGKTVEQFREAYLSLVPYKINKYKISPISEAELYRRIGDICISMRTKDYLKDLPERTDIEIAIDLPDSIYAEYKKFEREQVLNFETEKEITAINAGALCNKLMQFANGAVYNQEHEAIEFHQEKLDALEEIIEAAQEQPVLIVYKFQHDFDRIIARFGGRKLHTEADMKAWNEGQIPIALIQSQAGYGLNLQFGGHIMVWFGLTYSLEDYQQMVARLQRSGQKKAMLNYRIICKGTADYKIVAVLDEKDATQGRLMDAVKAVIREVRYAA